MREGEIFGVHIHTTKRQDAAHLLESASKRRSVPAAGPNSQLAQNIIAAYFAGARFFEVKTVQKMDGAELAACVPRPCILAADEGYNQEWSTELEIPQARDEYIKAWCAPSRFSQGLAFWATPTDSCSTCPSAMISMASRVKRSTPTSTI